MNNELKMLDELKIKTEQAEELASVEAVTISQSEGDKKSASIDFGALLGRAQMASAFSKMSEVVELMTIKEIKESKKYKELKGMSFFKKDGVGTKEVILTGTWVEFCELLGSSKSSISERLTNLELFGDEALKSMQDMGMTTRDLRKLRKLPEEDLKAVVDGGEVKVSDREEALEIIEEMAHKHRTEKTELQQAVAKLDHENKAMERILGDKDKKINELDLKLSTKLSPAQKRQKEEEINAQLLNGLTVAEMDIDRGLARFGDAIQTIQDTSSHPLDLDSAIDDTAYRVLSRLVDMVIDLGMVEPAMQKLEELKAEAQRLNLV